MSTWSVFFLACAVALLDAWSGRRNGSRHWYLRGIIPLVYGGAVAWMFSGRDLALSLRFLVYGSLLPILLLLWLWWDSRRERQERPPVPDDGEAS